MTLIQNLLNAIDLGLRPVFCTRASVYMSTLFTVDRLVAQEHCKVLRMVYLPAKTTLVAHLDLSEMYDSLVGFGGLVYIRCLGQSPDR